MAHDVFISYSTRDKVDANAVCAGLEAAGLCCWMAPRDILPGQSWPEAIINAIDRCGVLVLILSSSSNASRQVFRELRNAGDNGIPMIPFRLEDTSMSPEMRYYIGDTQWLDATNPPMEQHIQRLCHTVRRLIEVQEATGTTDASADDDESVPTEHSPEMDVQVGDAADETATHASLHNEATLHIAGQYEQASEITAVPRVSVLTPGRKQPWERPGREAGQELVGPDGGIMVWVPAGEFVMGSADDDEDAWDNEKPAHIVRLTEGFWLAKHTVTNAQYRAFCETTGRQFPPRSDQGPEHPAVCVSWYDAAAYAEHHGLSLPTEAQWEYAARGPDSRRYPWGDQWDGKRLCWGETRGPGGRTFPVGSFPGGASWCGALDMAGNVWEWCTDWFDPRYYQSAPERDPPGPAEGISFRVPPGQFQDCRVLRGGSWDLEPSYCRSAARNYDDPMRSFHQFGFRVAITTIA